MMKMKKTYILSLLAALLGLTVACTSSDQGYPTSTHYLPVQLQGSDKWSILDVESGEVVARDVHSEVPSAIVSDMYYVQRADGTFDYYNVSNPSQPVNAEPYGSVTVFSDDGLAVASHRGGPLEVIDTQCRVVKTLAPEVSQCSMFNHGRAAYQDLDGQWGYSDEHGDTVVAAKYASANEFRNSDLAIVVNPVAQGDTAVNFAVIDKRGEVQFAATSAQYKLLQPFFTDGVLPVFKGDTIVCLDGHGKEVANPRDDHQAVDTAGYQDYSRTAAGYYIVVKENKMGLVDKSNRTLIAPTHTRLIDLSADRYIVLDDSVGHLVDREGKDVGKARFVHVHGSVDRPFAARGIVDTDVVGATLLSMVAPQGAAGATAATTLMDMNSLLNGDALNYVGQQSLVMPQGPMLIEYAFDRPLASATPDSLSASFNYEARVRSVSIVVPLTHTAVTTEPTLVSKLSAALGKRGFIYDHDGMFLSEAGTALTLGYDQGLCDMRLFMHAAEAVTPPRNARK